MIVTFQTVLYILAFICFLLAAIGVTLPGVLAQINLVALGLALWLVASVWVR